MSHKSREDRLNDVRAILKAAGIFGAQIREKIPSQGGLRSKDVQIIIDLGEAEWIEDGRRARWIGQTPFHKKD